MKIKNLVIFTIALLALSLNACKNDFELTANYKVIPIVYCILDADSSIQYVKVQKAFIDKKTSAISIAKNPDSLYYSDNIKVTLNEINSNGSLGNALIFELVNGDTIPGFNKGTGVFAQSPNLFYRLKSKLNINSNYKLLVKKNDGTTLTEGTTNTIGRCTFGYPLHASNPDPVIVLQSKSTPPNQFNSVKFSSAVNAILFDFTLRTNFTEINIQTGDSVSKQVDWLVYNNLLAPDANGGYTLPNYGGSNSPQNGTIYYNNMASKLTASNVLKRRFKSIDIIVNGGNKLLYDYINIQKTQNGITGDNLVFNYSNLTNGAIGLIASRGTSIRRGIHLNTPSFDSLKNGLYTKSLNFY